MLVENYLEAGKGERVQISQKAIVGDKARTHSGLDQMLT